MAEETVRLNKYLALHLGTSRRESDELIESGAVTVDGTVAKLGSRVDNSSFVTVNDKLIAGTTALQYYAFHKPVGYVCSRKAQGDNPTIYALLPADMHSLKPVGRLDKDSSGILLLTNDGDAAFEMTHPKFAKRKVYHVMLDKELEPLHQQMISDYGVNLPDGNSQLQLSRLDENSRNAWIVEMREGRNRQIRRTFSSLGYTVITLHRVQFGSVQLTGLAAGSYESITL